MRHNTTNIMLRPIMLATMLSLAAASDLHAAILHVAKSGDGSNGLTWATAYQTISEALVHSASGDAVWIAGGTYNENIVVATSVALYGGFAGTEADDEFGARDSVKNRTTVDAFETNTHALELRSDSTIEGLTIMRGEHAYGGGVYCNLASVEIRDCTITNNRAFSNQTTSALDAAGGGIYGVGSIVKLDNVVVSENVVQGVEKVNSSIAGAGIYAVSCTLKLKGCKILTNRAMHAEFHFGAGIGVDYTTLHIDSGSIDGNDNALNMMYNDFFGFQQVGAGSALYASFSSIGIVNSTVMSNIDRSQFTGEAVYVAFSGLVIDQCRFSNNRATNESAQKTDLTIGESTCWFTNSIVFDGQRPSMYLPGTRITVRYCTFAANTYATNSQGDGIFLTSNTDLQMDSSVIWDNNVRYLSRNIGLPTTISVTRSNTEISAPGEGNISADPLFVNPSAGDFRLLPGSPCIDTASESGPAVDIADRPRPVDVIGTGRDGPGAFDMGAYEFQLAPADFNKDGAVNTKDLLIFQTYWNETQYD